MNILKEKLMTEARAKGICIDGYKEMRECDINALVRYYTIHPDWCMERDFPTLPVLREHFSNIEDMGVFVDKTFHSELLNEHQAYIFHNCKGTVKVGLNVDKGVIPMLYVANGCRMRFVGVGDIVPSRKQRSIVPVSIFGDNDISARDNKYVVFNRNEKELI